MYLTYQAILFVEKVNQIVGWYLLSSTLVFFFLLTWFKIQLKFICTIHTCYRYKICLQWCLLIVQLMWLLSLIMKMPILNSNHIYLPKKKKNVKVDNFELIKNWNKSKTNHILLTESYFEHFHGWWFCITWTSAFT